MKKRLLAIVLALCSLVSLCACGGADGEKPTENKYAYTDENGNKHLGLYVASDGTMMYAGKAFHGVGINYYSMINGSVGRKYDLTLPLETLELFKQYGVKVVRFNLGFYNSTEWSNFIFTYDDKNNRVVDTERKAENKHLEALDILVQKAEALGIGLIPSFAWNPPAIADAFDEPCNKAFASDDTATMTWFLSFVKRVVKRYAESPAIYAWEYGNEENLITRPRINNIIDSYLADQPGLPLWSEREKRTNEDCLSFKTHAHALEMFAAAVDAVDPYHRMIGSGDADQRACAYNWANDTEKTDTTEEFEKAIDMIVPGKMSAISMHEYAFKTSGQMGNPLDYLNGTDSVRANSFVEYFTRYKAQSARTGKAAYLGETGYLPDSGAASEALCVQVIDAVLQAAYTTDFPLVMLWNYDPKTTYDPADHTKFAGGTDVSWTVEFVKGKGYMEAIRKYNGLFDAKHASGTAEAE